MDIWVGRSRSCTCQEIHAKDMLTLTCWGAKYGETVQRISTSWFATYCIYMFFYVMQVPRSSVKFNYHVLIGKYHRWTYWGHFSKIRTLFCKFWKRAGKTSSPSPFWLRAWLYTIPILHFSIATILFSWPLLPGIFVYFSDLLAFKLC